MLKVLARMPSASADDLSREVTLCSQTDRHLTKLPGAAKALLLESNRGPMGRYWVLVSEYI